MHDEKRMKRMMRNERMRKQNAKHDSMKDRIDAETKAKDPTKRGGKLADWT